MPPSNLQISHYNVDTSGGLHLFVARLPGAVTDVSDADPPYYFRGFVDRHDPTVVGYTLIELTPDHARPAQVMVDDDYQRQGIATELYRAAEQTLGRTLEPGYGQGFEARELWRTKKWRQASVPGLQIDHMDIDDKGPIKILVLAHVPDAQTKDDVVKLLWNDAIDPDPTVVGYAQLGIDVNGILYPVHVYVDENYRRQGVASAMYGYAEKLTGKAMHPAFMQTDEAKALWETHKWRAGLTELGRKVFGDVGDTVRESLDLGDGFTLNSYSSNVPYNWRIITPNGDIAGSLHLGFSSNSTVPAVNDISVWPEFRGQGLGRRAVLALLEMFGAIRSDELGRTSDEASSMWEALGAEHLQNDDKRYGKSWYLLKKSSLRFGAADEVATVMVDMPWSLRQEVIELGKKIPEDELFIDPDPDSFTKGRESEPHVTVLHGLKTDDPSEVQRLVADFGIIKGSLGKTSIFSNEERDVLKVEIKSNDLVRLNKVLRDNLEFESDFPDYNPHITIAYLKPGEGKKYQGSDLLEGKKFTVGECFFSYDHKLTRIYLDKKYAAAKKRVMRKLAIDSGLTGWWLSPDGELIPIPPSNTHDSVARSIIVDRYPDQRPQPGKSTPVTMLIDLGWTTIRKPTYVDEYFVDCADFTRTKDTIIEWASGLQSQAPELKITQVQTNMFGVVVERVVFDGTIQDFLDKPELTSSLHKQADLLDDISVVQLPTLWYENEDGSKQYVPTEDDYRYGNPPPEWVKYQVSRFPNTLRTDWIKMEDDGSSSEFMASNSSYNPDLVRAIVDTGKFDFDEAVIIAAETCERCLNVLLHELGFPDGYPKDSEEYRRSNTKCEFCTPKEKITGDLHLTSSMLERGFWYLNGKLYDVSSEGGGGHHFGFIMAFEEPEVFGLSRRQQKALQGYYSDDPDRGMRETSDTQSAFQTIWNTGAIRIGFFPQGNAQIVVETKDPGSRLTEIQEALLATGVPIDPTSRILIDDWDENTFYDTSYDEIFSGDLPRPTRSSLTFPNQL